MRIDYQVLAVEGSMMLGVLVFQRTDSVLNFLVQMQAMVQRHAARIDPQAEQKRQAALSRISPSPSPFLTVPQTLHPDQVCPSK